MRPPRFLEEGSEFWLVLGRDPAAHHEEEEADEEEDLIPLPYLAPLSPLQPQLLFLRLPLQPRSSLPFLPPSLLHWSRRRRRTRILPSSSSPPSQFWLTGPLLVCPRPPFCSIALQSFVAIGVLTYARLLKRIKQADGINQSIYQSITRSIDQSINISIEQQEKDEEETFC